MSASKLRRLTLAELLLDELRAQVLSGRLSTGEFLPTERELCEAFGVGRTTVREALQGLVASGMARRQAGRLVVVDPAAVPEDELDYAALASRMSVRDVYATRKLLECEMGRLAAENHTQADLEELAKVLEAMDPAEPERYHALDESFHTVIAGMCQNEVLREVYVSSSHLFFKLPAYWRVFGESGSRLPFPGGGKQGHQDLYDAIASGDGERAAAVMLEHLSRVESRLVARIAPAKPAGSVAVVESSEKASMS